MAETVGLALLGAAFFALGTVLQQRGAMAAPPASSAGFVRAILTKPVWVAGGLLQIAGWIAQAVALKDGQLLLVQPIISAQVVIALPLGVLITHQRVGRREWLGALALLVGLTCFLALSNPSSGRASAPTETWVLAGLVVVAMGVALAFIGSRREPALKAALFGTAGGVLFAFQASATKVFVDVVDGGVGAILSSWSTYVLVACAVIGFYFVQVSLQAGILAPAVASTNAANPVASGILGRFIFQEIPSRTPGGKLLSFGSLALMLAGLLAVSRSKPAAESGGLAPPASARHH